MIDPRDDVSEGDLAWLGLLVIMAGMLIGGLILWGAIIWIRSLL